MRQVAWVFGGGSGLGHATAQDLKARGFQVVIFDIAKNTPSLAHEMGVMGVECDITQEQQLTQAMAHAAKQAKPFVTINCVGIAPAERILGKQGLASMDLFQRVIHINLCGAFNILRLSAFHMQDNPPDQEGQRGVIIQTASIAAFEGQIGQVAYSASKGGIVSMTLPAARELARFGIRVMTIAPGVIETPLFAGISETARAGLEASVPFPKRLGKPAEFSMLVSHIIDNPLLNGEVIRLDGALRMA